MNDESRFQSTAGRGLPAGCRTKSFPSSVGRRCGAAQEFRAERQLCPARKVKIFVLHPCHLPG
jgi:hypothetical protein